MTCLGELACRPQYYGSDAACGNFSPRDEVIYGPVDSKLGVVSSTNEASSPYSNANPTCRSAAQHHSHARASTKLLLLHGLLTKAVGMVIMAFTSSDDG